MLPRPDVVALLTAATVFACPSIYEPLGIVNLEAMACETAVVATATGGIPEPRRAQTPRARRRVAAEDRLRRWGRAPAVTLAILRAPASTPGRLPIDRMRRARRCSRADDDVYTNHIHADDLARAASRRCSAGRRIAPTT